MKEQSIWSLKFSTASIVLIPAAVGINYIGKLLAGLLKLPLWVDSIGTVLASMLAGPIIGALSGAINNIVYGLTADPISFVYGLTSVCIGLVTGILAYRGWITTWSKAFMVGVAVAIAAVIVSTPLNILFWGGTTGNVWGDALYAIILSNTDSQWLASLLDELVVDVPDKILTVMISYGLYRSLPQNLSSLYDNNHKVETLD